MRRGTAASARAFAAVLLFTAVSLFTAVGASAQQRRVDFAYPPARHLTAICFPVDWQKTVVTETGALA
ncbi:MAG TPA: hypothetical protein VML00_08820, partial [Bacteroidota bacterium]|nr:hypothetical protein [Bacteroidota bacterium]